MPASPRPTKPHLYCDASYWMIRMPDGEEHALADTAAPRLAIKRAKDTSAILEPSKRPAPTATTTPLQQELERFLTPEERAAGFVSKKRANEVVGLWRLWRFGGGR
jgi:hypothetical protein